MWHCRIVGEGRRIVQNFGSEDAATEFCDEWLLGQDSSVVRETSVSVHGGQAFDESFVVPVQVGTVVV